MKNSNSKRLSIALLSLGLLTLSSIASAQTIGWIGIGDFNNTLEKKSADSAEAIEVFANHTTSAIAKTRKFKLLTNAQLKERLLEDEISLSGYYKMTNPPEDYEQAGLDYILTGDVTEMGVYHSEEEAEAVGMVKIDFRVISVSHGTEGYEDSISAESAGTLGEGVTESSVLQGAMDVAVEQLVAKLMTGLFPIRVMKISEEGVITLNYGDGVLKTGDTLRMFAKPTPQRASSNESGAPIATLQVLSTDTKFSIAQALEGGEALEIGVNGELLTNGG